MTDKTLELVVDGEEFFIVIADVLSVGMEKTRIFACPDDHWTLNIHMVLAQGYVWGNLTEEECRQVKKQIKDAINGREPEAITSSHRVTERPYGNMV